VYRGYLVVKEQCHLLWCDNRRENGWASSTPQ